MGMSEEVEISTDCHEDDENPNFCYICGSQANCVGYGGFLCDCESCQVSDNEIMELDCWEAWVVMGLGK
jgi:hypothetical protein